MGGGRYAQKNQCSKIARRIERRSGTGRDLSGSAKPVKRKCLLSEVLYKSALKIAFEIN